MAKDLSKEMKQRISRAADVMETAILKVLMDDNFTMHEGLAVISCAVSDILATSAKVLKEDEKKLIETFCESLKV